MRQRAVKPPSTDPLDIASIRVDGLGRGLGQQIRLAEKDRPALRYCCSPLPSLVTGTYVCPGGAGAGSLTMVVVALARKDLREHLLLATGTYASLAGPVLAALPR